MCTIPNLKEINEDYPYTNLELFMDPQLANGLYFYGICFKVSFWEEISVSIKMQ